MSNEICKVVSHDLIEVGIEKVYFTGTYVQCLRFLRRHRRNCHAYDIVYSCGRLASWVL